MTKFAIRLKELRKEKGLTQSDLAKLLFTSQDTISLWELDKSLPDIKSLIKMTEIFNVSADYLIGLKDYWLQIYLNIIDKKYIYDILKLS